MKRLATVVGFVVAFLFGYGYGHWYAEPPAQVSAKTAPAALYYRCPMHPAIRSDKPGLSPCCHMAMVPVSAESVPSGAVRVSAEQESLLGLKYAAAKSGVLSETIRAVARLGLDDTRIAHVQTKLDGYVDQVLVKTVGTEVRKGQVLMTVYHPKSMAAQEEYISAVKGVMGVNAEPGETGPPRPANAEGVMAAGRLRLELMGFSEPQIETITKSMQPMWRLQIAAPISGVVTEVNALPRQRIIPETLYTIADLSTIWATADLFANETAPAAGQSAVLRIAAFPGREFPATVDSILPQLDSTTHTRKVRVRIENPDRKLLPEMYGDLEFHSAAGHRSVLVPREAVLDRGMRKIVFVNTGQGYVETRDVTTGRESGSQVEVLRGLRPGEMVVTSGHFLLDAETRVPLAGRAPNDRTGH
jgi:Cu(I)/Ag(I) efflux system membrane fusion protein